MVMWELLLVPLWGLDIALYGEAFGIVCRFHFGSLETCDVPDTGNRLLRLSPSSSDHRWAFAGTCRTDRDRVGPFCRLGKPMSWFSVVILVEYSRCWSSTYARLGLVLLALR